MIDIDHFKRFNDEFGHDAGDMVMRHVASILITTVGETGDRYRFGGEEFTVLLANADETAGVAFAQRIRTRIRTALLSYHGRALGHVTVSIGVATTRSDSISVAELVSCADAALLAAKGNGRDQVIAASELGAKDREGKFAA